MSKNKPRFPEESRLLAQIPISLYVLRKKAHLNQEDVAQTLHITRSAYTYYERGVTVPGPAALYQLSLLYSVPMEAFLIPEKLPASPNKETRRDTK